MRFAFMSTDEVNKPLSSSDKQELIARGLVFHFARFRLADRFSLGSGARWRSLWFPSTAASRFPKTIRSGPQKCMAVSTGHPNDLARVRP